MMTMVVLMSLIGGYILSSYFFLKYPSLLHKKKKLKFKAVHISHRGGAGEHLENTLAAFYHAREQGTDMFEIDCHITKDGQVVVTHDNDLERATGQHALISETCYRDLPLLHKSLRLDFQWRHVTLCQNEDRRIPLLRELYEHFPQIPVNIDIKVDNDQLIKKVSDLTKDFNREDLTVWGNRCDKVTKKCYQENPNIPLLFSMRRVLQLLLMYYSGLLPFVKLKESAYEIPMPSILLNLLMSKGLFQHLSDRGIQTYLWVLNDEEDFERAFQYGATGVMTDFPTKLRQYLNAHPIHENHD